MEMEGVVNGLRVCVCGRKDVRGEGGQKSEKRVDQEEKIPCGGMKRGLIIRLSERS